MGGAFPCVWVGNIGRQGFPAGATDVCINADLTLLRDVIDCSCFTGTVWDAHYQGQGNQPHETVWRLAHSRHHDDPDVPRLSWNYPFRHGPVAFHSQSGCIKRLHGLLYSSQSYTALARKVEIASTNPRTGDLKTSSRFWEPKHLHAAAHQTCRVKKLQYRAMALYNRGFRPCHLWRWPLPS